MNLFPTTPPHPLASVVAVLLLSAFVSGHGTAIEPGQIDDFGDGTTMGWTIGVATDPLAPTVEASGGPAGAGDAYMLARSTGLGGSASKLVLYNDLQWTGDYEAADVDHISMYLNNLGENDLLLRLRVESAAGGNFVSVDPVSLPATPGWQLKMFPINAGALTGGTDIDAALRSVSRLRIFHGETTAWSPVEIKADLGIDDIAAVPGDTGIDDLPDVLRGLTIRSVYPNPARDDVSVDIGRATGLAGRHIDVVVVDVLGRSVANWTPVSTSGVELSVYGNVRNLPSGLYWVTVTSGASRTSSPLTVTR